ncbi:hypothetical protein [Nitrincola iocasae]|uniref:Uncharacterized protein n=1 Tax=Nitrincola iocasae TaxID=2614693 RepID=A0A5J6LJ70_9GAMM|nr:hypothetical protein [Nitrincola iocasae]QEW08386.1 hypothetical protein F5I99_18905 [Nitrincola iocasae]
MAYVIADTGTEKQKLYAFDSTSSDGNVTWELVRIENTKYDHDGAILLNAHMLSELKAKNVAVFESKKSAKSAYHKLGISTCRYVELVFEISHEYKLRKYLGYSSWTKLNKTKES